MLFYAQIPAISQSNQTSIPTSLWIQWVLFQTGLGYDSQYLPLSKFWGGGLPHDLNSLMSLRKEVCSSCFSVVKIGMMTTKLFTC